MQDCPFVERAGLKKTPAMPGGSPYMLIANLDESIVNCLTWDLFRQGKLTRFFVVSDATIAFRKICQEGGKLTNYLLNAMGEF